MRRVNVGSLADGSRVDDQLVAETFTIEGAVRQSKRIWLQPVTAGHSQNCAEFCQMEHTITINGLEYTVTSGVATATKISESTAWDLGVWTQWMVSGRDQYRR